MVPSSLSQWFQRYGRAGRSGGPAIAILLVEPSVFQQLKRSIKAGDPNNGGTHRKEDVGSNITDNGPDELEDEEIDLTIDTHTSASASTEVIYRKKIEEGLRKYLDGLRCRRDIADTYFSNPRRPRCK